jgi:hypothetical protein
MAKYKGIERATDRNEIETLELSLNDIEVLKMKVINNKDNLENEDFMNRINKIDKIKLDINNSLETLRNTQSKQIDFNKIAKWYEYGEKPNKFFLNLINFRSKQKIIDQINDGQESYVGQEEVMRGIRKFYQDLYSKKEADSKHNEDTSFFDLCPKLSDKDKASIDEVLTLEEMYKAVKSCKDSAPGPDGIPYSVYKIFWPQIGIILKESWEYSIKVGKLPDSHKESVITILPKEGKDLNDIKNWRPITLSNCDAKIITKALATRVNKVLDTVIDTSQTAYVPGRSIMDNIRGNNFMKQYCKVNNIDAVLVSLDAKKAFDSVNHEYIDTVLVNYGFGENFRLYFKTLYSNLSAKILINGYLSEKIGIERGVKQGDALSCAIFILCIDPLIRNINSNKLIRYVPVRKGMKKLKGSHKASGFADDISIISMSDDVSIKQIFMEYQRLTNKSGLTLNADKTEILNLYPDSVRKTFEVKYDKRIIKITSIDKIKICGIYFCSNSEIEHRLNVVEKIAKLRNKLRLWQSRHLTLEGKSLILKTFGISQLIYNMQCVNFESKDLKVVEQYIFNFLWGTKNIEDARARDRIKRTVMKNDYNEGGLKITDIECLDKALKLKQYIRANNSNHVIKDIQNFCTSISSGQNPLSQEFCQITKEESVCNIAQETLNIIIDQTRKINFGEMDQEEIISNIAINQIAMTNVENYLKRKGRVFLSCTVKPFVKEGLETYLDFIMEAETEQNDRRSQRLESIISAFPKYYRNAANSFNENCNQKLECVTHLLKLDQSWIRIEDVTTRDLQWILKKALGRISVADFHEKLGIGNNIVDPLQFRADCRNSKARNIYFRMIHNDFFTYSRMFKFKMTADANCPRCGLVESTKHLLWDCIESQKIWKSYNETLSTARLRNHNLNNYEDLYRVEAIKVLSIVKLKLVQEMIQIIRPMNWTKNRMINLIGQLKRIETHNNSNDSLKKKWEIFDNVLEN